jgi:hypothetical protein
LTWTVRLHTIPEDKLKALAEYCMEAALKDPTFQYHVERDKEQIIPTLGVGKVKCIIIECENKDQAYRRGMLFHGRFGCYFEVEWRTNK